MQGRHILTCLFSALLLLLSQADAQETHHHYSICGDVYAPRTYEWPASDAIHVLDLLKQAGETTPVGTAMILRGGTLADSTSELIHAQMAGRGSRLQNHDIVIFHSRTVSHRPATRNALLLLNNVPDVIEFQDHGLQIARALAGIELPSQVQVTRTLRGRSETVTIDTKNGQIRHGDIIHLRNRISTEQVLNTGLYTVPPASTEPTENAFHLSGLQQEAVSQSEPGSILTIPGGSTGNDLQVSLSTDIAESVHPDNESETAHAASNSETSAADTASLIATYEEPQSSSADSSTLWNVVFTTGLLLAAVLIAAGWLKTRHERDMATEMEAAQRRSLTPQPELVAPAHTDDNVPGPVVADDCPILMAGLTESTLADSTSEATSIPARGTSSDVDASSPAETADAVEHYSAIEQIQSALAADVTRPIQTSHVPLVDSNADELSSVQTETLSDLDLAAAMIEVPAAAANDADREATIDHKVATHAEDSSVPEPSSETWGELEDLIQNRLPVELTELQLPLRINLFGKPAGPKRLRIDAAHSEIPAPHMMSKSRERRSGRRQSATVSISQSETQSAANTASQAAGDFSRLDNALSFLEEQSGS